MSRSESAPERRFLDTYHSDRWVPIAGVETKHAAHADSRDYTERPASNLT